MSAVSETRSAQGRSEIPRQKCTIQTFSRIPTSDRVRNRSTPITLPQRKLSNCVYKDQNSEGTRRKCGRDVPLAAPRPGAAGGAGCISNSGGPVYRLLFLRLHQV